MEQRDNNCTAESVFAHQETGRKSFGEKLALPRVSVCFGKPSNVILNCASSPRRRCNALGFLQNRGSHFA